VSSAIAGPLHLHSGSVLKLAIGLRPNVQIPPEIGPKGSPVIAVHVAGVYRALDSDLGNPFWANFLQDVRARNPDSPMPPTFVLVPESTLLQVATRLRQRVANLFEYPVDASRITLTGAKALTRRYAHAREQFGCRTCTTSSSLDAVLVVARRDVDAVSSSIVLVTACALAVSLALAAAAGVFLVRRRADEVQLLYARGLGRAGFGGQVALETLPPAIVGLAGGFLLALISVRLFAPAGTLDGSTVREGAWRSLEAAAAALVVAAVAAAAAFAPRSEERTRAARRAVPWEVVPLAVTGVLVALLLTGGGLASGPVGSHPKVSVFLLPVFAAIGVAGVAATALRLLLRGRAGHAPVAVFLAVRRLAAARGALVAVIVTVATAIAVFAYAMVLAASLDRTAAVKAFVGNGSDVQGVIDPHAQLPPDLAFPAAIVAVDIRDFVAGGTTVDVVAGDPSRLARVIRWGPWPDDPRTRLRLLEGQRAGVLPVLASPDFPAVDSVDVQGVRLPIRIAARVPIPGMSAGSPALLVSRTALQRAVSRSRLSDPLAAADWLVWAKGDPQTVSRQLEQSSLDAFYVTTLAHISGTPSVVAAKRSFRYFETLGAIATVLALFALVLYLQARRRSQLIASALVRRMGLQPALDLTAVAVETAAIAVLAVVVGIGVAVVFARIVIPHLDPLPQYAPGTILVYPWWTLAIGAVATVVATVALTAIAVALSARSSVGKALRLA
jgi:hypothetical protein